MKNALVLVALLTIVLIITLIAKPPREEVHGPVGGGDYDIGSVQVTQPEACVQGDWPVEGTLWCKAD